MFNKIKTTKIYKVLLFISLFSINLDTFSMGSSEASNKLFWNRALEDVAGMLKDNQIEIFREYLNQLSQKNSLKPTEDFFTKIFIQIIKSDKDYFLEALLNFFKSNSMQFKIDGSLLIQAAIVSEKMINLILNNLENQNIDIEKPSVILYLQFIETPFDPNSHPGIQILKNWIKDKNPEAAKLFEDTCNTLSVIKRKIVEISHRNKDELLNTINKMLNDEVSYNPIFTVIFGFAIMDLQKKIEVLPEGLLIKACSKAEKDYFELMVKCGTFSREDIYNTLKYLVLEKKSEYIKIFIMNGKQFNLIEEFRVNSGITKSELNPEQANCLELLIKLICLRKNSAPSDRQVN